MRHCPEGCPCPLYNCGDGGGDNGGDGSSTTEAPGSDATSPDPDVTTGTTLAPTTTTEELLGGIHLLSFNPLRDVSAKPASLQLKIPLFPGPKGYIEGLAISV